MNANKILIPVGIGSFVLAVYAATRKSGVVVQNSVPNAVNPSPNSYEAQPYNVSTPQLGPSPGLQLLPGVTFPALMFPPVAALLPQLRQDKTAPPPSCVDAAAGLMPQDKVCGCGGGGCGGSSCGPCSQNESKFTDGWQSSRMLTSEKQQVAGMSEAQKALYACILQDAQNGASYAQLLYDKAVWDEATAKNETPAYDTRIQGDSAYGYPTPTVLYAQ